MAASSFPTTQYTSEHFVESAGAVLFHISTQRICLIHYKEKDEWLLAKGRRNCGETRRVAAVREMTEETGLQCRLLDVKLNTRAPPAESAAAIGDVARSITTSDEPFMLTLRKTNDADMKLIWWYIAIVDEEAMASVPEEQFTVGLFQYGEALQKLTFENDRAVVRKAIEIVQASL